MATRDRKDGRSTANSDSSRRITNRSGSPMRPVSDGNVGGAGIRGATGGSIFDDVRSGRDRRDELAIGSGLPRSAADRRRGKVDSAWWLERGYVDSHVFGHGAVTRPADNATESPEPD